MKTKRGYGKPGQRDHGHKFVGSDSESLSFLPGFNRGASLTRRAHHMCKERQRGKRRLAGGRSTRVHSHSYESRERNIRRLLFLFSGAIILLLSRFLSLSLPSILRVRSQESPEFSLFRGDRMTMMFDDCFYNELGPQLQSTAWDFDHMEDASAFEFDQVSFVLEPIYTTGYLEDAIAQWDYQRKRRRTAESDFGGFCASQNDRAGSPFSFTTEQEIDEQTRLPSPSSSSSRCTESITSMKEMVIHRPERKKKKTAAEEKGRRVVCPFAVVRAGWIDGGATLEEINRRLMMRPSRPIRHPVGEFASIPCFAGGGPGLSGKTVVGLTRIFTRGNGTITIVRTAG